MTEIVNHIPARLKNAAVGGHVAGAEDIIDDVKGKTQDVINAETDDTLDLHQSEINALDSQNYATVGTFSELPATGSVDTIYRVSNWDGSANSGAGAVDATVYSEYAWDDSNSEYKLLDVKTAVGEVFDISLYRASGGVLAEYADLSAALDGGNNVPSGIRRGGMSVKFVQSSDSKYVQYTLTSTTWTIAVAFWKRVDVETSTITDGDFAITDEGHNAVVIFNNGHVQTKNFDSSVDASPENRGLMSSEDKTKLNAIEAGAEVNNVEIQDNTDDYDLALADERGNAVAIFGEGNVKTKNFNSAELGNIKDNVETSQDVDFALMDNNHNAVVKFAGGHIKTKNFDSRNAARNSGLEGMMGSYYGYNLVTVGVGRDYPTIQEAINSITDASISNQYIVLVYDDFYVDDITELWKQSNKNQRISSISEIDNGETCAYIWTKDYVHIVGKGQRTIHVALPSDVINTNTRRSYVHNVYHKGSARLENLKIISQNVRYCIHSEGGDGSELSEDYCAIKHFINLDCIYIGHEGWDFQSAFGVGTGNGLQMYIENCRFTGKNGALWGGFHTHPNYRYPAILNFKNCVFDDANTVDRHVFGELYSGQNSRLNFEGCTFHHFWGNYNISLKVTSETDFDMRNNRIQLHGHGNKIRLNTEYWSVLHVDTKNVGESITAVSGDVYDILFKECFQNLLGTATQKGQYIGCIAHTYSPTNKFNQNFGSIGYKLGDCSVNNKILTITAGGHTETVVFDKNYGGLVDNVPTAYYSDWDIVSEMNSQLTYCEFPLVVNLGRFFFDDEVEVIYNNSNERLLKDRFVTKDNTIGEIYNAVKLTSEDDYIYGVTVSPINPHDYGLVVIRGKGRLWNTSGISYGSSNFAGKYYKAGNDGIIMETQNISEACLYGTDNHTLDWI